MQAENGCWVVYWCDSVAQLHLIRLLVAGVTHYRILTGKDCNPVASNTCLQELQASVFGEWQHTYRALL